MLPSLTSARGTMLCIISGNVFLSWALGVLHTCPYNHAHRHRLEKLLYVELSGCFKPLPDPGGGFASETAITYINNRFKSETVTGL